MPYRDPILQSSSSAGYGELLGLVSIGDVVKARLEETKYATESVKAYIVAG
jgi:hypothetical protein